MQCLPMVQTVPDFVKLALSPKLAVSGLQLEACPREQLLQAAGSILLFRLSVWQCGVANAIFILKRNIHENSENCELMYNTWWIHIKPFKSLSLPLPPLSLSLCVYVCWHKDFRRFQGEVGWQIT